MNHTINLNLEHNLIKRTVTAFGRGKTNSLEVIVHKKKI